MNKILFLLLICTISWGPVCFAQEEAGQGTEPTAVSTVTYTFTGIVKKVFLADFMKSKTTESLLVMDDNDKVMSFIMHAGAVINDEKNRRMSLNGIKEGDKVTVEYRQTKTGIIKLKAIQVLAKD